MDIRSVDPKPISLFFGQFHEKIQSDASISIRKVHDSKKMNRNVPEMLEDEVDDEGDVEALVVGRDKYAILRVLLLPLLLLLLLHPLLRHGHVLRPNRFPGAINPNMTWTWAKITFLGP